jgi:hypothetical protein
MAPLQRLDFLLQRFGGHWPDYAQISASVGTFLLVMTLPMRETFIRCL